MLIVKTILYRVIRLVLLLAVAYIFLGDIGTALSISFVDTIVATIYYYMFERFWSKYALRFKYRKLK